MIWFATIIGVTEELKNINYLIKNQLFLKNIWVSLDLNLLLEVLVTNLQKSCTMHKVNILQRFSKLLSVL